MWSGCSHKQITNHIFKRETNPSTSAVSELLRLCQSRALSSQGFSPLVTLRIQITRLYSPVFSFYLQRKTGNGTSSSKGYALFKHCVCCSCLCKVTLHSSSKLRPLKKCNYLTPLPNYPYFADDRLPKQVFFKVRQLYAMITATQPNSFTQVRTGGEEKSVQGGADRAQTPFRPPRREPRWQKLPHRPAGSEPSPPPPPPRSPFPAPSPLSPGGAPSPAPWAHRPAGRSPAGPRAARPPWHSGAGAGTAGTRRLFPAGPLGPSPRAGPRSAGAGGGKQSARSLTPVRQARYTATLPAPHCISRSDWLSLPSLWRPRTNKNGSAWPRRAVGPRRPLEGGARELRAEVLRASALRGGQGFPLVPFSSPRLSASPGYPLRPGEDTSRPKGEFIFLPASYGLISRWGS